MGYVPTLCIYQDNLLIKAGVLQSRGSTILPGEYCDDPRFLSRQVAVWDSRGTYIVLLYVHTQLVTTT